MHTHTDMFQDVPATEDGDRADMKKSTNLEAQLDLEAPDPSL